MINRSLNILITGATSGIGEALALHYAATSAKNLFICGRNENRLLIVKKKCEQLGTAVFAKIIDVTNRELVKNWIEECENIAPLNLVIANAGVGTIKENTDSVYNTFDTNIFGVVNTVLPTLEIYKNRTVKPKQNSGSPLDEFINKKKMQKQAFYVPFWEKMFLKKAGNEFFHNESKAIAIVSSIAGYHGLPTCPSYSASKACVKAWGEALRIRCKKERIKVSVICPGFVRSGITDQNTCPMPFFMEADVAAKIIAKGIAKNKGLIAFPWPLRFAAWLVSILPNKISDLIYGRLPDKA